MQYNYRTSCQLMLVILLVSIQSHSKDKVTIPDIPDGLSYRVQTVCRDYVKNHLKAPDSAEFQDESKDYVQWERNFNCHHKECSVAAFFVSTRAYALNTYGARLLHQFGCHVICESTTFDKDGILTHSGDCRVGNLRDNE